MIKTVYCEGRKLWLIKSRDGAPMNHLAILGASFIGFNSAKEAAIKAIESEITEKSAELKALNELLAECVELEKPKKGVKNATK